MKFDYTPIPGEMFVDLSCSYRDVKVLQAYIDKENNRLYATYIDDETAAFVKKPIEEYNGPFFPFFSGFREHRKELDEYYAFYMKILSIVNDFLRAKNYSASFVDIATHLETEHNIKTDIATASLTTLTANNLIFTYKSLQSGEYLSFSKLKIQQENSKLYYGSLAEELKIKSDKISLLVSHGQTVGNYREFILRDLLRKYLPSMFSVATGFIEGFSRQLDIIIYDSLNFSPTFSEGDLVVIQQEAVRAVIEVKTNLNATNLFEALEMFHEISLPGFLSTNLPIFKGIFAFSSEYVNASSISEVIDDFYNKPYYVDSLKSEMTRDILYLYHEITCVCVAKQHCLVTQYAYLKQDESTNLLPILLSVKDHKGLDIQTATFLSRLFDYLDVGYYAKKSSIWNFSNLIRSSTEVQLEKALASAEWIPRTLIGHKGDHASIKERHKLFIKWFRGEISTAEFIKSFIEERPVEGG
ncbi:DUF6602 domain-containing protein [Sphingobacterium psychroaquaticum]|uniref:DUF6602 domain-containing protein n=1 Tax=Sphingobacterium psychroaquaticum TaxID=561061 RepID=A0A1X7LCY8_9SPHI|nr:DUF6602 domain-containing protein [Sphingobacterium psychroaquaticum]SMG51635.1 hypothetical protein SAMN05660862_0006 [Sphingobacterium psychroaquaticum]